MKVWIARYGWYDEGWIIGVHETQLKAFINCLQEWKKECSRWSMLSDNPKKGIKYIRRFHIEEWEVQ